LDDVAHIHPLHETLIKSQLDHTAQGISMPVHQLLDRQRFSPSDVDKQLRSHITIRPY
jgi:hypothetical protein